MQHYGIETWISHIRMATFLYKGADGYWYTKWAQGHINEPVSLLLRIPAFIILS